MMKLFSLRVALLFIGGCISHDLPLMFEGNPYIPQERGENIKFNKLSQESAESGWKNIHLYYLTYDTFYLKKAAEMFNYCWRWNPNNYNAYWGWGIIAGIQAERLQDPTKIKKQLDQAINLLQEAKQHDFPREERNNLDLAKTYNDIASFYLSIGKEGKTIFVLEQSQKLVDQVLKIDFYNGRAYFLLSVNFY